MIRAIWVLFASALLGACSLIGIGNETAAPTAAAPPPPTMSDKCEALRRHFPMPFHADLVTGHTGGPGEDQADTVKRIRELNAGFASACP